MFMRGAPQRRQSEGNKVAKRASAIPLAHETSGLSRGETLVPVARIEVPLLLKTILLHPAAATGAPTGGILFSIAALDAGRNEHNGTYHLLNISGQCEAYTKTSGCAKLTFSRGRRKYGGRKFLVRPGFWGYLYGALVLNLGPLSACAVKTAHIQESD
jgi:hypothetical protein